MSDINRNKYANKYAVVTTTCSDGASAEKIAAILLEQRLAACAQMFPISSRYIWKGEMRADSEVLLHIKCRREYYADIERVILENHGYELPEILLMPIEGGYVKYLEWMDGGDAPGVSGTSITSSI
ncbi:MAG: divalent-cation tolerance protein CutA [Oscillospiraceae bacterium]|jgi:periplasmic divalent cation tolerance protein|nr:divalent-cation tolerance protein CutA [Oscillospiraceae bacterium]